MFGAPGEWNLKRCINPLCRLAWLDPMPASDDIGKAYTHYYTHTTSPPVNRGNALKRVLGALKCAYLAAKYGYQRDTTRAAIPQLGWLFYLFPVRRIEADGEVRFLRALPNGCLLDVGCGSGDWLVSMRERGWKVTGVDLDENAAALARRRGLTVNCGALERQNFADDSFDAITLNHVIEHVPDPIGTLRECARILKPGGTLAVFTPNGSSLGHRIYKEFWRGLEPPRHLHIFTLQSMRCVVERAGFARITVRPWFAPSMIYESHLLRQGWRGSLVGARGRWPLQLLARFFIGAELLLAMWKPSIADCVTAIAVK